MVSLQAMVNKPLKEFQILVYVAMVTLFLVQTGLLDVKFVNVFFGPTTY